MRRRWRSAIRSTGTWSKGTDAVGKVAGIDAAGTGWRIWFRPPDRFLRRVVAKGSIAVNGVSLEKLDDAIHLSTGETEQNAVNLRVNPHVVIVTGGGT